ncbi:hypothetical protein GCM10009828_019210 [Actinoplanes couchii]|uniref:von Hippel-Lindau disease tumour suppressor beta domain-containing protein n=2 Tax=Actinoplanes couchii TaxID=403638 RepID=A0ABQ3XDT2_9ACTN|nr:hypothetical protein Aco03nite_050480 [Actinoplanes couchii]
MAPAVDPYDPPLVEVDTSPLTETAPPAPEPEAGPGPGNRRLIVVVLALAAVLGAGGVVMLVQLWPSSTPLPAAGAATTTASASAGPAASADPGDPATWPELNALPAALIASLRSVEDGADTRIVFVNERADAVVLSWVDENGKLSPYATVEAGQAYEQKTFAGHFWSAAGADGTVIAVFQATAQPGRVLLR